MLKLIGVLVFILVTTVSPYASAKGIALDQNQHTLYDFNTENILEEKLENQTYSFGVYIFQIDYIEFPAWILLKPQCHPESFHKPPSLVSFT